MEIHLAANSQLVAIDGFGDSAFQNCFYPKRKVQLHLSS